MKKLNEKIALITGAGSGIGKAIAMLFASEGAFVIVSDINLDNANDVVKDIQKNGGKASVKIANVANIENVKQMVKYTINKHSKIDILVNNAGILDDFLPVDEISADRWNKIMEVNLNSVYYTCHSAIPEMLKAEKGVIINIASVGGLVGGIAGAAYTASKHAVVGLTKNIGYMYANKGIRCNAIAPGGVETNIAENMKPSPFGFERTSLNSGSMPRVGKPNEIAQLALFLASDDSSFINATVVTADAGWMAI